MPTTSRRRHVKPTKQIVLNVMESVIGRWIESGGTFSVINLEKKDGREGLGLVFDGAFVCVKCEHFFPREGTTSNLCKTCQKAEGPVH